MIIGYVVIEFTLLHESLATTKFGEFEKFSKIIIHCNKLKLGKICQIKMCQNYVSPRVSVLRYFTAKCRGRGGRGRGHGY